MPSVLAHFVCKSGLDLIVQVYVFLLFLLCVFSVILLSWNL